MSHATILFIKIERRDYFLNTALMLKITLENTEAFPKSSLVSILSTVQRC